MTREIGLSAGTIEYEDTGGEGPAIVLLPGLLMDASVWDEVVGGLAPEYRLDHADAAARCPSPPDA